MIYNEEYIGEARNIHDLVNILRKKVPANASIKLFGGLYTSVEVWYDKDTNTVILK